MNQMRVISYGGGVQSTAMIVLATQGKIKADVALFSNVGDDSEHPTTIKYVREIAIPFASAHGLPIHELSTIRKGKPTTIWSVGDVLFTESFPVGLGLS